MHITAGFFPHTALLSSWALGIYVLLTLLGFIAFALRLPHMPRLKTAGLIMLSIFGAATLGVTIYDGSTNETTVSANLQQEAQRVYGLQLTDREASLLTHINTGPGEPRTQHPHVFGSTYVHAAPELHRITLMGFGTTTILVKQSTKAELPRLKNH